MLNRLFVVIGFIVILAIGGAFVIPRFIQWSDYRPRLEAMATQAFGTDVEITGDISLTLLPQQQDHALPPRHQLEQTLVWDTDAALLLAPHATRTALYDLQAAGPLPALAMGKEPRAFVISRGRAWVLSKSGVAVWDLRARTCSQQIKSPLFKDHMMSLAVSRDEKLLAIGVGREIGRASCRERVSSPV